MKKILLFTILLMGLFTTAQTLTSNYDPYTQDIEEGGMLSCFNDADGPSTSSYYNFYHLSSYDIDGDTYEITSVEFGIENISGTETYPITVKLYSTLQNFPEGFETLEGYTLLANQTFDVPAQELSIYSVPVTAEIPSNMRLLVELHYEEELSGDVTVILGGNMGGSWGSTWTVSETCGITTPTTMATIAAMIGIEGVPTLVMNVMGEGNLSVTGHNKNLFTVYPNPTTDYITIQTEEIITSVTIIDITGKTFNVVLENNTANVKNLAPGIYYLHAVSTNGAQSIKFVKE